jgi:hypothetical protein
MADEAGLRITISADVRDAILHLTELTDATGELAVEGVGNITAIDQALQSLRAAQKETGDVTELNQLNRAIRDLSGQATQLKRAGTEGFDDLGNKLGGLKGAANEAGSGFAGLNLSLQQSRVAFTDVGRLVSGQGFTLRSLAGNMALIGPAATFAVGGLYALYEILSKQTDEEKKAEQQAKELHDTLLNLKSVGDIAEQATGSEAGNIARVQALAAVVQDVNKAYKDRQNALEELKETNKSYFGDLTLEASSLALLKQRVNEYSQALITEATVKGQVEEIAKLSEELQKQLPILKQLSDAYQRQSDEVDRLTAANTGKISGREGISSDVVNAQNQLDNFKNQYQKQNEAVATLKDTIRQYTDALNENIQAQVQQRPLKVTSGSDDDLNKIKSIREEIAKLYAEMGKQSTLPLFQQRDNANPDSPIAQAVQADIDATEKKLRDAAGRPELQDALRDLIAALSAKLSGILNPDLHVHFALSLADIDDKEVKQFHDNANKELTDYMKRLPPLKSDVKVELNLNRFDQFQVDLHKKLEDLQKKLQGEVYDFTKAIQDQFAITIGKGFGDILAGKGLQNALDSFMQFLGDSLEKLGEQLIVASGIFSAVDVALDSLLSNPALAAAAGIAAIAAGEVIKSSFKAKPFATGGIVTGPTLGLVGEAGPEVIFPLDRLNSFLKNTSGGPQEIKVTGMIRGRDLAIVGARDSKLQGLTS